MSYRKLDWIEEIFPSPLSGWRSFIKLINKKEVGGIITRKEYLKKFGLKINRKTLDLYRYRLSEIGYLEYIEPGSYKLIKKIPDASEKELFK